MSAEQGASGPFAYALMWSGGKDSMLALLRARSRGLAVARLVNVHDTETGRVRFHATSAALIRAQSAALGVDLRQYPTTWAGYEATFRRLLGDIVGDGLRGVIFGDIHLADVRAWYESRVRDAGLEHVEPVWGVPSVSLLHELVDGGHRAVITCCEEGKLDRSWLGRTIDEGAVRELVRLGIDPAGENGEYHSFVYDGPSFARPVAWRAGRVTHDGPFVQLELDEG